LPASFSGFLSAPAIRTGSPSTAPSGGLSITRSSGARPEPISTNLPKSRAIVTFFNLILLSGPTVATRKPDPPKISALGGTLSAPASRGRSRLTLAKPPGSNSPFSLSTASWISMPPEAMFTACAVDSTVAANLLPGRSGTLICALVPRWIIAT
jgi:hypothetical protein